MFGVGLELRGFSGKGYSMLEKVFLLILVEASRAGVVLTLSQGE
jgi:hypothetical protein